VPFPELKPVKVETGITFGQECYLDPSRSHEFHSKVNSIFPNFFTRNNFQRLPEQFVLENPNRASQCIVKRMSFNYSVDQSLESNTSIESPKFLNEVEEIFNCFKDLFAVNDVRRVGIILDFQSPASFTKASLSNILRIDESVEVNNLHLLSREEGKNINIHFRPFDRGIIELEGRKIDIEPGVIIRCDINNIEMSHPLDVSESFKEVFGFANRYVQTDLVNFLNKYFGDTP
jgi:hypothetical protein